MRLTLRTLLAYLDDTLEPSQARLIGQKIAESEQARDLIDRIRQVTRRRRITTAPDGGPGGKLDPNTLGEYLDNAVSPEQAAEVEEICLTSDTHLADVAACHQILSLVLGEPALVPPSATRRMYGLVKGPEAIPFRKPRTAATRADDDSSEGRDVDDTLRLGMAPVTGRNKGSPWLVIVAGATAVCLLLIAVWQIIKPPDVLVPNPNQDPPALVLADPNKDKAPPTSDPAKDKVEEKKEIKEEKKEDPKDPIEIKLPPVVIEVPWASPSATHEPLGQVLHDPKEPGILLQYNAEKDAWQKLGQKSPEVASGRRLVSLPGSSSVVQLSKGLQLTLVGSMYPELFYAFPLYESSVELHSHEQLDLDLTLRRGRIRIAAGERPARIRVRFENPTQPSQAEFFDISLQAAGSEVLIDRWSSTTPEKYFRNPKDVNRVGPVATMACVVLKGTVLLRAHDVSVALAAPPGPALVAWNSFKGLDKPVEMKALPDGLFAPPALPMGIEPRMRTELLRARDDLQQRLLVKDKDVDVALAECLKTSDPALRRLAASSLGAVDDVAGLVELLEQEAAPELRPTAIEVLRHWLASGRDNDYRLYEQLKPKYKTAEAENIITLLHGYGEKDLMNPDTYDLLIHYLNHSQLALRELAAWQLYRLVPAGQKIKYNASADPVTREQAQAAWRALIPPNQLPPMKK